MKNFFSKLPASINSLNLRTRLILGNLLVTFLAVAGLGFYVYYRAQQNNAFLIQQLDKSVLQAANDSLTSTNQDETNQLNNFFASAQANITSIGAAADNLLLQEAVLNQGVYWNAAQSMSRLPNGSWDNSSRDVASVFIPGRNDLTPSLVAELNTLRQLDFTVPTILKANPDVIAIDFGNTQGAALYYPNIDLASIVPPTYDVTQRPWFIKASPLQDPQRQAVWSDPYVDAAHHGLVVTVSIPVYDAAGNFRGAMAMDIQLNRITAIVSNLKVGQTGFAFLIDKNYKLIAMPQAGYKELGIPGTLTLGTTLAPTEIRSQVTPEFWKILDKMSHGQSGLETIPINGTDQFFVYSPLSSIGYSLAIMVPRDQMIASATAAQAQIIQSGTNTLIFSALLILGILVVALLAAMTISSALTSPLVSLTQTAQEITRGNLHAKAEISTLNEIGTLATALNTMTASLRENIQSLEERVKERTFELEAASQKADRRATQFEAIVLIVRAINSIHEMNMLLPQITSVISEQMGYYHVGIFLNNEDGESAVLSASNSKGGERMLERGHRLKIGEQGIVGYVAATGKVRVALNVGDDAVYFNNPDLPETLSEMALPLRVENQIVGVLDVQSTQSNAFSQDDIGVLSLLADEVSLAIENTRLFETTNKSLSEAEALYRQYLHGAWKQLPHEEQLAGFRYGARGASILEMPIELDDGAENDRDNRLTVPIQLRGETIGKLSVTVPQDTRLSQDQMDLIQAVAERLALSTENARLFDVTNRRAERERMVTEITSKIRSTNNPEEMISVALKELRSALGATRVQLIPQTGASTPKEHNAQIPADPKHNGNGAK